MVKFRRGYRSKDVEYRGSAGRGAKLDASGEEYPRARMVIFTSSVNTGGCGSATASAVGDDRIQETATGSSNPHTFSHGTAEQRIRWFSIGFDTGEPSRCDTFSAEYSEL